jgi:hypothetical protein
VTKKERFEVYACCVWCCACVYMCMIFFLFPPPKVGWSASIATTTTASPELAPSPSPISFFLVVLHD